MNKKIILFILLLIPLALAVEGDSCTLTGQVDYTNNLFCDTDLTWTAQLQDCSETNTDCECQNNYECISLKCYNGFCGGITYEQEIAEQESFFEGIWNMLTGACKNTPDCYAKASTIPFCHNGKCEQLCETDQECSELGLLSNKNYNFCDDSGYCIECSADTEDTDCTTENPYCSASGFCVECTTETQTTDCESDEYCTTAGTCIKTTTDEDDDNGNGNGNGAPSSGGGKYSETTTPDQTITQQQASQSYCGDGTCYFGETYATCPEDCPSSTTQQAICGDGVPDYPIENCENCPLDVVCEQGEKCIDGECIKKSSFWTWFIIILLILALIAIIFVYKKTRKKTIIKPEIKPISQPQKIQRDFFQKSPAQILLQRRQRQLEEQKRQQFLNQRRQNILQQQKQQSQQQYKKDLLKIAGIGEKIADNIIRLHPTKTLLKQALARGSNLPFKKIIIEKLKRNL